MKLEQGDGRIAEHNVKVVHGCGWTSFCNERQRCDAPSNDNSTPRRMLIIPVRHGVVVVCDCIQHLDERDEMNWW